MNTNLVIDKPRAAVLEVLFDSLVSVVSHVFVHDMSLQFVVQRSASRP